MNIFKFTRDCLYLLAQSNILSPKECDWYVGKDWLKKRVSLFCHIEESAKGSLSESSFAGLSQIIQDEKLREPEARKFMENAFQDGEIKTTGTDIDKLMPPVSRFGGGGRAKKKQRAIDMLKGFFEKSAHYGEDNGKEG